MIALNSMPHKSGRVVQVRFASLGNGGDCDAVDEVHGGEHDVVVGNFGGDAGQPFVELAGDIDKQRFFRMGLEVLRHGALALRRGQVFAKPHRGDIAPQLSALVINGQRRPDCLIDWKQMNSRSSPTSIFAGATPMR